MAVKLVDFVEKDLGYNKVVRSLMSLTDTDVLIGFIENQDEERKDGEPINNATLAYIHEYGSHLRNIPRRPFLQPAFELKRDWAVKQIRTAINEALDGNKAALNRAFNIVGAGMRDQAKLNIRNQYKFAPLSDSTLKARRRRGVNRTKALIDTGQLLNAIHYRVIDNA